MDAEQARARLHTGKPEAVREIHGCFALVAHEGKTVRMARSLDRPMRPVLAKRQEGPVSGCPKPALSAIEDLSVLE